MVVRFVQLRTGHGSRRRKAVFTLPFLLALRKSRALAGRHAEAPACACGCDLNGEIRVRGTAAVLPVLPTP